MHAESAFSYRYCHFGQESPIASIRDLRLLNQTTSRTNINKLYTRSPASPLRPKNLTRGENHTEETLTEEYLHKYHFRPRTAGFFLANEKDFRELDVSTRGQWAALPTMVEGVFRASSDDSSILWI